MTNDRPISTTIRTLFRTRFGEEPTSVEALRADGSNRRIWRLRDAGGRSAVAFFGPDRLENRAFLSFSSTFRSLGLPVPEIYAEDLDAGVYLEEDLGDRTLLSAVVAERFGDEFPQALMPTYHRVLELLVRFQVDGGRAVDFSVAHPVAEFDRRGIMWDLNYFKYDFLKLAGIPFHETRLELDFERLTEFLLQADRRHFMYRDFQPRNIMLRDGEPWFIDYQGGRRGALQYDVASLLYSSKTAMPDATRALLLDGYVDALSERMTIDREVFLEQYRGYVLVRILQLLGAYGFRGYYEGKAHFLESVPYAVRNIEAILASGPLPVELPELRDVLSRIAGAEDRAQKSGGDSQDAGPVAARAHLDDVQSAGSAATAAAETEAAALGAARDVQSGAPAGAGGSVDQDDRAAAASIATDVIEPTAGVPDTPIPLTVTIRSFSYKQGYPEEQTAHGGGFVFDCRALHNPGRYEEYKPLCGLDEPVVRFLEREEAVETFFTSAWTLVSAAVRTYLDRGFEHLSAAFGCTGGQHRSVYFAERLARTLRSEFPEIAVEVLHRETRRWPRSSEAPTADARRNSLPSS